MIFLGWHGGYLVDSGFFASVMVHGKLPPPPPRLSSPPKIIVQLSLCKMGHCFFLSAVTSEHVADHIYVHKYMKPAFSNILHFKGNTIRKISHTNNIPSKTLPF